MSVSMSMSMLATTTAPGPDPGLPYDPDEVLAGVLDWVARLATRHAARVGRPALADDLAGELAAHVLDLLRRGKYDPARSLPTTYVATIARTTLPRATNRLTRLIHVPHSGRTSADAATRHAARLADALVLRAGTGGDGPRGEEAEYDPPDPRPGPASEAAHAADLGREAEALRAAMATHLDDRSRFVLRRRFGLDEPRQTLRQIGDALGLTKERVRQVEAEAIRRLRAALDGGPAPAAPDAGPAPPPAPRPPSPSRRQFFEAGAALGWDAIAAGRRLGITPEAARGRARRMAAQGLWPPDSVPGAREVAAAEAEDNIVDAGHP